MKILSAFRSCLLQNEVVYVFIFFFPIRVQANSPSPLSASLLKTPKTCMHLHPQEQIRGPWVEHLLALVWEETPKVASLWRTTPIPSY